MRAGWVGVLMLGCAVRSGRAQGIARPDDGGLQRQIEAMTAEPAVVRAHWGVLVSTMEGAPLASVNAGQFFQPASNAKLYTTAAAIALLGPDRRFATSISGYGVWEGATKLTGDLTLRGDGDAFLSGREVPYRSPVDRATKGPLTEAEAVKPDPLRGLAAMADQVAATGLHEVNGDVVAANLWEPYPPDWSLEDTTWYYGAPVSAMSINDNQIDVVVAPGKAAGDRPIVTMVPAEPAPYAVDVSDLLTGAAKSGSHVGWELAPGSKTLRLHGTIATDAAPDAEGIAIQDPAEYAGRALKGMLEDRGVRVSGAVRVTPPARTDAGEFGETVKQAEATLETMWREGTGFSSAGDRFPTEGRTERMLATRRSPTVAEDVVVTNKTSQNLHAELMLDHLAEVVPPPSSPLLLGRTARGVGVLRAFLTARVGIDSDDVVFYDGSGLSGHDLVTPRATTTLLRYAATQPWFAAWRASLPVGGVDGSLVNRFTKAPLRGRVFAKTGTLGEARALSGYLQCASGRTVVFSIMVSNHAPGGSVDREVMDRIVGAVYAAE